MMRHLPLPLLGAALLATASGCPFFTTDDASPEALQGPSTEVVAVRPPPPPEPRQEAEPPSPPPRPRPTAPAQPEPAGETVSARHILLQYQGSMRAGPEITRSKEEARAEAERIANAARQAGADFASLAREHSDGPSAPGGGDLGEFGRRRMHPAFEEAAFGLEVGATSGIVETPFGFHVIQRYR